MALTIAISLVAGIACGPAGTPPAPIAPMFGNAVNLGSAVNSPDFDGGPSISADGLVVYFVTDRDVANGGEIWTASRQTTAETLGMPQKLRGPVNSSANEGAPSISADGLDLFFDRAPDGRIFVATRPNTNQLFGAAAIVDLGNGECCDGFPSVSADGLELYFCSTRAGGFGGSDVWVARRSSRSSPFAAPRNLGPMLNSPANDCEPGISKDGLTLLIESDRSGGMGGPDVWISTRTTRSQPFGKPVNLGRGVNTRFFDERPDISADGTVLYFMSNRPGGSGFFDLWEAVRTL